MADVPESAVWEDGIYQLEVTDDVLGGPGEISNRQATELANRTAYLKQQVEGKAATGHNHDGTYSPVAHNHVGTYATPAYVDAQATPVGAVISWPTEVEPTGWLPCEGAAISRDTYAALFAVLGVKFGPGNGVTTFNLPDYRGYFLRGWDHGAGVDPDAGGRTDRADGTTGDHVGTVQADGVKAHSHGYVSPAPFGNSGAGSGLPGGSTTAATSDSSGGNETRPINKSVLFIIKY
jgi:microcystin-dependent protein